MKGIFYYLIILISSFSFSAFSQQKRNINDENKIVARVTETTSGPEAVFGDFTEISPVDAVWVTPPDQDFWVISTAPADYDNDGDFDIAVLGYYVFYNFGVVD